MSRKTVINNRFSLKLLVLSTSIIFSTTAFADAIDEARQSFTQGAYTTAVIQLKNLLQDDPNNIEARLLIGRTYLKQFEMATAIKELEKARDLGAEATSWLLPLSHAYLLSGQYDKVLEVSEKLAVLPSLKKARLLAIIGNAQLGKNQIADAKETLNKSLAQQPNTDAKTGLARIAMFEQQLDKALTLLDEALELKPSNLEALVSKSQVLAAQGEFPAAIKALNQALDQEGRLQNARLMRAELYIRTNQFDKARLDTEKLIEQNPNNGLAYFTLARLQLNDQEYSEAQISAEKALRFVPQHLMSHFVLGAAHYAQQHFQQAQFYLEKFISAQPNHLIANRLLGAIYLQLEDAESAIELLQAFETNTNIEDAQLLNLLGNAYLKSGDYTLGTETLNRALAINPDIKNTRTQLAIGQIATGDIDQAISELENAIDLPDATEQTSIMLILSYLNQKQFGKAFAAINKANKQYPTSGVFYNLKGMAYENQKDIGSALNAYQQALNADSSFIPALLALAKLDIKAENYDAASNQLKKALNINKNHLQSLLLMAQTAQLRNDTGNMIKWMQKARDRNSENVLPVRLLINYYLTSGQSEKALNEALAYYTNQGKTLTSLSLMADVASARGEIDKARSLFEEIVANYPNNIEHRLELAQLLVNNKEYKQALVHLDTILANQPTNAATLAARASTLIAAQQFEEAKAAIKQFSETHPEHFMIERLKGDLLLAHNKTEAAIKSYTNAFIQRKTTYLAHNLSRLHEQAGNTQGATRVLAEYLQAAPNDHQTRTLLASLHQRAGANEKAIGEYEKIVTAAPSNVIALNNLAWLYLLQGSDKALSTAEKAYQLAPNAPEVIDTYGWIMLKEGNKQKALKLIQAAISKSPANPDIRYHYAKALAENGDNEQAKKEVNRLLRDYNDFEEETAAKALAATLE